MTTMMKRSPLYLLLASSLACSGGSEGQARLDLRAPTVSSPAPNAMIASPLSIAGVGVGGAGVTATLSAGDQPLGQGAGVADASGAFRFDMAFTDQAEATSLTLRVSQVKDGITSATAVVLLTQRGRVTPTIAAPVIVAPATGAAIASPVDVSGTGLAGASIAIEVLSGTQTIGQGSATVDAAGQFVAAVQFNSNTATEIRVHQTKDGVSSPDAAVSVTALATPMAPSITSPVRDARVASPVVVRGQAQPGLRVKARVRAALQEIGAAEAMADVSGAYEVIVAYTSVPSESALTIEVTQSNAAGDSNPTTVAVMHRPITLGGKVFQKGGGTEGPVYVRLYTSGGSIVDHLDEVRIDPPNQHDFLGETEFSFSVGDGDYVLRAFRDTRGSRHGQPDGQPTLPDDPQAPGVGPITMVGVDSGGHVLEIDQVQDATYFDGFDVMTRHESAQPEAPYYESRPGSGNWMSGEGLCRGFYMSMQAGFRGPGSRFAPQVKLPTGEVVELVDDGGCGDRADNRSSGYDNRYGDGQYSFGLPDPTAARAGDYVLFHHDRNKDVIHIAVDTIEQVTKISRNIPLTSPTGADVVSLRPQLNWNAVPSAAAYRASIWSWSSGFSIDSGEQRSTSYTPQADLPDDAAFRVEIMAYDAHPATGDVDAVALSIPTHFITDADRDSHITISGALHNITGATGDYYIEIEERDSHDTVGSVVLPATATSYSIKAFRNQSGDVRVQGFIDVDGSGDPDSSANASYEAESSELTADSDRMADLRFSPAVILMTPAHGARNVGNTPVLSWQDYSADAPAGPWMYAFWVQPQGRDGGFPPIVWAVPNTVTSFDLANPPSDRESYDVVYLGSCFESGGNYVNGSCEDGMPRQSASDLSQQSEWAWGVIVLQCDWNMYRNSVDADHNGMDDMSDCLGTALGGDEGMYATSRESGFTTD